MSLEYFAPVTTRFYSWTTFSWFVYSCSPDPANTGSSFGSVGQWRFVVYLRFKGVTFHTLARNL